MIDWNWFFAAYAQCGAALIGIIAAFIISKIIGENEKEEQLENSVKNLLVEHSDLIKRIKRIDFNEYNKNLIWESEKIGLAIDSGTFRKGPSPEELSIKLIEIEPHLYSPIENIHELRMRMLNSGSLPNFTTALASKQLVDEREFIESLRIESETLIDKFNLLKNLSSLSKNRLTPIKTVIIILMVGFVITVAYPLHFLPLPQNVDPSISFNLQDILQGLFSGRNWLIISMTIVIEGILIYFLYLIGEVNGKYQEIESMITPSQTTIKEYSKYFK